MYAVKIACLVHVRPSVLFAGTAVDINSPARDIGKEDDGNDNFNNAWHMARYHPPRQKHHLQADPKGSGGLHQRELFGMFFPPLCYLPLSLNTGRYAGSRPYSLALGHLLHAHLFTLKCHADANMLAPFYRLGPLQCPTPPCPFVRLP